MKSYRFLPLEEPASLNLGTRSGTKQIFHCRVVYTIQCSRQSFTN